MKRELLAGLSRSPVIAAVRTQEELLRAAACPVRAVFLLGGSILTLPDMARAAHEAGKAVFLHIDLAQGLGHDEAAVEWCARSLALDGLISTKGSLLRCARGHGLITVQRLFLVDSASLAQGLRVLHRDPPDMAEVLPGIAPKGIRRLCEELDIPVIAGGLITEAAEVSAALASGACAVSAGREELWRITL